MLYVLYHFSKNFTFHEMMWKNMVQSDRLKMMCMHTACWITETTNTHSEYVILTAFPQKQCLHERTSMLHLHIRGLSQK